MDARAVPLPLEDGLAPAPAEAGSASLESLASLPGSRVRSVQAGTALSGPGRPLARPLVIQAGVLASVVWSSTGRRGVLAVRAPGDVAGLELLARHRPAAWPDGAREVRALTECRLVWLDPAEVVRAAARDPTLAAAMLEASLRWASRVERAVARQLSLDVAGRVLSALRELADALGASPVGDRTRVPMALSQETIAAMVGATRESVNRAVRALAAQGLLRRDGRRYSVAAEGWGESS